MACRKAAPLGADRLGMGVEQRHRRMAAAKFHEPARAMDIGHPFQVADDRRHRRQAQDEEYQPAARQRSPGVDQPARSWPDVPALKAQVPGSLGASSARSGKGRPDRRRTRGSRPRRSAVPIKATARDIDAHGPSGARSGRRRCVASPASSVRRPDPLSLARKASTRARFLRFLLVECRHGRIGSGPGRRIAITLPAARS